MDIKLALSFIATGLAIISYVPYIRDMLRGKTKPHAFSWLIWSIIAYIAGTAQLRSGGGFGSMVAFTTGTMALWISYYSLRHRAIAISRGDWVCLILALCSIPLWLVTHDPLLAVITISIVDLIAFWITIRKTYRLPYSENLTQNVLSTLKHILSIAAQRRYNWVTILYPLSLAITTAGFCTMILIRRSQVAPPDHKKEATDVQKRYTKPINRRVTREQTKSSHPF